MLDPSQSDACCAEPRLRLLRMIEMEFRNCRLRDSRQNGSFKSSSCLSVFFDGSKYFWVVASDSWPSHSWTVRSPMDNGSFSKSEQFFGWKLLFCPWIMLFGG